MGHLKPELIAHAERIRVATRGKVKLVLHAAADDCTVDEFKRLLPSGVSACFDVRAQRWMAWSLVSSYGVRELRTSAFT